MNRPLDYGTTAPPKRARRLRWAAVAALVLLGTVWVAPRVFKMLITPKIGLNQPRDQAPIRGLPPDAAKVSYHLPEPLAGPVTAYEFDTSEASFLAWSASAGWPTRPIVKPVLMLRFDMSRVTIERGHFYDWTEQDAGRHTAYDAETGRAYFWSHTR